MMGTTAGMQEGLEEAIGTTTNGAVITRGGMVRLGTHVSPMPQVTSLSLLPAFFFTSLKFFKSFINNVRMHHACVTSRITHHAGGDRQFWCEWDGAGANNACPRSCGSCSWRTYNKDEQQRALKEHLLHEHFDPQEPPDAQEQPEMKSGASKMLTTGPEEPKRIAERRRYSVYLLD